MKKYVTSYDDKDKNKYKPILICDEDILLLKNTYKRIYESLKPHDQASELLTINYIINRYEGKDGENENLKRKNKY